VNEKVEDKKLGRNPFDRKKPERPGRHRPEKAPVVHGFPAEPAVQYASESERREVQNSIPSGILFPMSPAWFFVDLWAGMLMEPYFFWAGSIGIMKRKVELVKTPRIPPISRI